MTYRRGTLLRSAAPVAGAVLVAIIALALHPHLVGRPDPQAELHQIGALGVRDRLVHGTLLLLIGALLAAFARYALGRGLSRQPVLLGLVSFAVGIGSLFAAGLIDGFILPALAAQFVASSAAAQEAAIAMLAACSVAVNVTTAFGLTAMAIAIAAWSLDLAHDPGAGRVAGLVGFASAAFTVAALVMGGPFLNAHTLIAALCAQGVWYVWIAVLVARREAISGSS